VAGLVKDEVHPVQKPVGLGIESADDAVETDD
jgi:hypothetical protein